MSNARLAKHLRDRYGVASLLAGIRANPRLNVALYGQTALPSGGLATSHPGAAERE